MTLCHDIHMFKSTPCPWGVLSLASEQRVLTGALDAPLWIIQTLLHPPFRHSLFQCIFNSIRSFHYACYAYSYATNKLILKLVHRFLSIMTDLKKNCHGIFKNMLNFIENSFCVISWHKFLGNKSKYIKLDQI